MNSKTMLFTVVLASTTIATSLPTAQAENIDKINFVAGDASLQSWLLPKDYPYPEYNAPTPERTALGEQLFFDPRLSGDKNMACSTCHNPAMGWSDGLAKSMGAKTHMMDRSAPTIVNIAYTPIIMWDGRIKGKDALEKQVFGPVKNSKIMGGSVEDTIKLVKSLEDYRNAFAKAYPGEDITEETIAKAIANYERSVVSIDSPFDRWVAGDASAMSTEEIDGFKLFLDKDKGNCAACHSGPNFTDNGFHNIGIESSKDENADVGRYKVKPIKLMFGAFRTLTVRDAAYRAPYFHDGSVANLDELMDHYIAGGKVKDNISPNLKPLDLTKEEKKKIIAFMYALSPREKTVNVPTLPMP